MTSLRLHLYLHASVEHDFNLGSSYVQDCMRLIDNNKISLERPQPELLCFEAPREVPLNRSTCEALQIADLLYQRFIYLQKKSRADFGLKGCSLLIHQGTLQPADEQILSLLQESQSGQILISESAMESVLKKSPKHWGCITLQSDLQSEVSLTLQAELQSTATEDLNNISIKHHDEINVDQPDAAHESDDEPTVAEIFAEDEEDTHGSGTLELKEIADDRVILLGPQMKAPSEARFQITIDPQQRQIQDQHQDIALLQVQLLDRPMTDLLEESPSPHQDDPQRFGKYELDYLLGRGGMGEVWLAKDRFGHPVAIKLMLSGEHATEKQLQRFQREARIMSNLQHRNICRIIEVDEISGTFYIAMEFIKGVSLSSVLRSEDPDSKKRNSSEGSPDTSKFLDRTGEIQEVIASLVEADEKRRLAERQWEQENQFSNSASISKDSDPLENLSWISEDIKSNVEHTSYVNIEDMMAMFDESIASGSGLIETGVEDPLPESIPLAPQNEKAPAQEIFPKRQVRRAVLYRILPLQQSLALMIKTCHAVHFAHEHGVYHRDIKPGNLMLRVDGEPLVMDFGLAKLVDHDDTEASISMSDQIFGTLDYMAPEQARSSKNVDERADVYSLGAILYQMITGRKQFSGTGDLLGDAQRLQTHEPVPPRKHNPLIESDLAAILLKALRNDPAERYANVAQMARDLENYRDGKPVSAKNPTLLYQFNKWYKRHAVPATISAFALIVILSLGLSFGTFAWWEWQKTWSGWKSTYEMDMLKEHAHTNGLHFRIADNSREGGVIQIQEPGLSLFYRGMAHWAWVEDASTSGDVRLIANIRPESHGRLDMVIHGQAQELPSDSALPAGVVVSLLIGQNRSTLQLYRSELSNNNILVHRLIELPINESHELILERSQDQIIFEINDKEVLRERFLLPLAGNGFEQVGLRASSPEIYLESLEVYRKSQPEKASPLVAGDALVEIGQYDAAIRKYLTIANDVDNSEIVELALTKAFLLAARPESKNEALILELEKRIQTEFPDSDFLYIMKRVEIERLWINGYHDKALDLAQQAVKQGDQRIVPDMMKQRPISLQRPHANRLLALVKQSNNLENIDLSYLRDADFSTIAGQPFRAVNARHLGLTSTDLFKQMRVEEIDLAHNQITSIRGLEQSPLHYLNLAHNPIRDLSPIAVPSLERLIIDHTAVTDLSALSTSKNLEYLSMSQSQISSLAGLENAQLIVLKAHAAKIRSLERLRGQPLEHLMLAENQVSDLSPLKGMPLKTLVLAGNPVKSLEPLREMKLRELIISQTQVQSLLPIEAEYLTHLAIAGTQINDLSYIREFVNLQHLEVDLAQLNHILTELRPIGIATLISSGQGIIYLTNIARHFPDMHILNLSHNRINNLEPLSRLQLNRLNLAYNQITSLDQLRGQELRSLVIPGNRITSISPLVQMPLTYLDLALNPVSSIDALKDSPLKYLNISNTPVNNLQSLKNSPLETLYAANTMVEDISALEGLPLRRLDLSFTRVKDLNPLHGMYFEELRLRGLALTNIGMLKSSTIFGTLDLHGNHITDISVLRNMPLERLYLNQNSLAEIEPLKDLKLRSLDLSHNPIKSLKPIEQNPPQGLLFDIPSLNDAELERLDQVWGSKQSTQHHARNARVLLALRKQDKAALLKEAIQVGDRQFLLIPKPVTWRQARALANHYGATLANLQDPETNEAVRKLVPYGFEAWIGLKNITGLPAWENGRASRFFRYHTEKRGPEFIQSGRAQQYVIGFRAIKPNGFWTIDFAVRHKPFVIEWAPEVQIPTQPDGTSLKTQPNP